MQNVSLVEFEEALNIDNCKYTVSASNTRSGVSNSRSLPRPPLATLTFSYPHPSTSFAYSERPQPPELPLPWAAEGMPTSTRILVP